MPPPPPPPKAAGLLASRWFENRAQVALTSVFVLWGGWLAAKKLSKKDTPEELRHDPLYEVHHEPRGTTGSRSPASMAISKKAGMVVEARPGDRDADPIAAASGGTPLVVGVFPNASITKSRIGDATPAGRRAAAREAERAKK